MKFIRLLIAAACFGLLSFIADPNTIRLYFVRMEMSFKSESKTEVYIFTDWDCLKCKELNGKLISIAQALQNKAKVYFIDLNPSKFPTLTKVNEALLLNKTKELERYLKIRQILFELAEKDSNPSEEKIKLALEGQKLDWTSPPEEMLQDGLVFFEAMKKNFQIDQDPSILIYNLENRKNQKLEGDAALNTEAFLKGISALQEAETQKLAEKKSKKS